MNAITKILSNAEAVEQYKNNGSDCKSIRESNQDGMFNSLITGSAIGHRNQTNDFALFSYETALYDFCADADINEFNKFCGLFSELRNEQNEAEQGNGDIKPLLAKVQALTDMIDTLASKHIDDNYERICEYKDGGIDYAA